MNFCRHHRLHVNRASIKAKSFLKNILEKGTVQWCRSNRATTICRSKLIFVVGHTNHRMLANGFRTRSIRVYRRVGDHSAAVFCILCSANSITPISSFHTDLITSSKDKSSANMKKAF